MHHVCHDLFKSPAQTLVNTVNTVGVMGKGIAQEFKRRYPEMFERYREHCKSGALTIGKLYLYRTPNKWVLNFPTKEHWKSPSRLEWIEVGLRKFVAEYEAQGITSIAFPQLGCGNGGLDWAQVKPLMDHYLKPLPIPVFVHTWINEPGFVPEHERENRPLQIDPAVVCAPTEQISFYEFLADFMQLFGIEWSPSRDDWPSDSDVPAPLPEVDVRADDRALRVSGEALQMIWDKLISAGAVPMRRLPGLNSDDSMFVARQLNRLRYIEPITFVDGSFEHPRPEPGIQFSPASTPEPEPSDLFKFRVTELQTA